MGPRGGDTVGRCGPSPGLAGLVCGPTRTPPTLPFRLLKVSVAKTLPRSTKPEKTFQSHRHREAKIWGTGVSVPARRRDGEVPPEGFSIDITAISINAVVSHEEGVVLHRGSGLYR